ncbi:hypothetical protein RRG08_056810 [Elysia crispata]|uniref:Uncharacterized protein n=1 Tax=Elysia crispata TaxID=231223 RepID=A0AAE1ABI0_9GAST|nr:hypothetical protein RRG08_056810 [Elysia crispata]
MKNIVLRPLISPPKLDHYSHLSKEAQVTLAALEAKYDHLIKSVQRIETSDSAHYYKSIYDATFKKENETTSFRETKGRGIKTKLAEWSRSIKHASQKKSTNNCVPRKDYGFCSELLMTDRPPDEEITQSILLLTQTTSAPESPLIDFESNNAEDHEQEKNTSNKRFKLAQYFSDIHTDITETNFLQTNHTYMQSNNSQLSADDDSVNKGGQKHRSDQTNTKSIRTLTPTLIESENPLFALQNEQHKRVTSPILGMWNDSKPNEDPCPSPLLFASCKENSQTFPEGATFELNVSDSEIGSPCSSLDVIKKEKCTVPCIPHSKKNESATAEESSFFKKNEISSQSPQTLITKYFKAKPSYLEQPQLHFDLTQIDSVKTEAKVLNSSFSSSNPQMTTSKTKRKKSAFKPPPKTQNGSTGKHQKFQEDVVHFENLTSQDRKNILDMSKLSSAVALTLVYDNGTALCTSFPSTVEDFKVRDLAVFANERCYLIPGPSVRGEVISLASPMFEHTRSLYSYMASGSGAVTKQFQFYV